jgi:hypothetical protein
MKEVTKFEDWKTPVYITQCKTWSVACQLVKSNPGACTIEDVMSRKPPHSLRIVKACRNKDAQKFRDLVALEVRQLRKRQTI